MAEVSGFSGAMSVSFYRPDFSIRGVQGTSYGSRDFSEINKIWWDPFSDPAQVCRFYGPTEPFKYASFHHVEWILFLLSRILISRIRGFLSFPLKGLF